MKFDKKYLSEVETVNHGILLEINGCFIDTKKKIVYFTTPGGETDDNELDVIDVYNEPKDERDEASYSTGTYTVQDTMDFEYLIGFAEFLKTK